MAKNWSEYQKAVFEHIERSPRHLVVEAKPGSGKTTTSVEGVNRIAPEKRVLMCAFNKKIQEQLEARVRSGITVRTFNSLGYNAVLRARGRVGINADRQRDLVRAVLPDRRIVGTAAYADVLKIVEMAMARLAETDEDFHYIMSEYDCYPASPAHTEHYIAWAREVLRRSLMISPEISFNDQIYIAAKEKLSGAKYDYVFVDEAQDCNPAQLWLVENSLAPGGKLIAVGDRRQAIYAWRGADHHVMSDITAKFEADVLPLSITYRCPKSVVRLVNHIVPDLEAAPDAQIGTVQIATEKQFLEGVASGDIVISRTNAAIARYSMRLMLQGTRCVVLGKDLSKGLLKLLDKGGHVSTSELFRELATYETQESERLIAAKKESKVEELRDRIDALKDLSEGLQSVPELRKRIEALFGDNANPNAVTFSTVHKAKGLEYKRVWMFETTFNVNSLEGENLYYVAATRAIEALYLVQIPRRDNKPPRSIAQNWEETD